MFFEPFSGPGRQREPDPLKPIPLNLDKARISRKIGDSNKCRWFHMLWWVTLPGLSSCKHHTNLTPPPLFNPFAAALSLL